MFLVLVTIRSSFLLVLLLVGLVLVQPRVQYSVMHLKAHVDYEGLLPKEIVESDLCVTIMPLDQRTSLSSGEEVLLAHRRWVLHVGLHP